MNLKSPIILIGCLLLAAVPLLGQSVTSTLIGSIIDQSNAAVPGAQIKLTDTATGVVLSAESDDAGTFRFLDVKPAVYKLRIQRQGFKQMDMDHIQLASSEVRNLGKLVIDVGSANESVTVTAESTPVQTSSSERSALVDTNQLNDVSLKGRDTYGYLALIPGVVDTGGSRDMATNTSQFAVNINGMVGNTKNVSFDGVTALDPGGNYSAYINLNPDAVSEIRVLTNGYAAEYGRAAGGAINMITKSGTNQFHGSGYWNRRHENLNANDFFNNRAAIARPLYRYNIGGATIGGPVYIPKVFNRDRRWLFFFLSQERGRERIPTSTAAANMPTALELAGDFSQTRSSTGSVITIVDPVTRVPFPGNRIPTTSVNAVGLGLLKVFPSPNGYVNPAAGQQYSANFLASATPTHTRSDTIARFDGAITSKVNAYYRLARDNDVTGQVFTLTTGSGGGTITKLGTQHTAHVVATLSPTTVNDSTFGFGGINTTYARPDGNVFRSSALNPPTLRPMPTGELYGNFLPNAYFSGGVVANRPSFYSNALGANASTYIFGANNDFLSQSRTLSFQDDLTKVVGSHTFKTGVYAERTKQISPTGGGQYNGRFNFGSTSNNPLDTGDGYANALLGVFQTYGESTKRVLPYLYFWEVEGYVQDSWRPSSRLTIDIGVRWIHHGPIQETNGAFAAFYPSLWDKTKAATLYRPTTVNGKLVALNPLTGQTTYQSLIATIVPGSGLVANGMHVDGRTGNNDQADYPYITFTPRVGFAWDVYGNGKMSIRGSFGQFTNRVIIMNMSTYQNGASPVVDTPTIYYTTVDQLSNAATGAVYSPVTSSTWDGPQKVERSTQTNLTIQRSIGFSTVVEAGYVLNVDRHAQQSEQLNPIPKFAYADPANLVNGTAMNQDLLRTKYPGSSSISYWGSDLSALNYHALQTQLNRRAAHGLGYGLSYTFSKALGTSGWDPYNPQRERYYGPLSQDRTHALTFNYSYTVPTLGQQKILKAALGGWTISGIVTAQSGAPVTPSCSYTGSGLTIGQSDPSLSGVTARCQLVGDLKAFNQSFYTNFNTNAITVAPAGSFGNLGIGVLRQPSWNNIDTSVTKRFPFGKERRRALAIRIESYNTLNHTEFSSIGTTLQLTAAGNNNNTTTGQYTAARPSRQLSTTLRIEF